MKTEDMERGQELQKEITELENFLEWCSNRRDTWYGRHPWNLVVLRFRWWVAGTEISECDLSKHRRLAEKILDAVEEEIQLLKKEYEEL